MGVCVGARGAQHLTCHVSPQFPDGGVAEERGPASCGDQVRGGMTQTRSGVPFTLRQEGSCRVMLILASVPGILTITRRMIMEPSCHRW